MSALAPLLAIALSAGKPCDAAAVIADVRAATGGQRWEHVSEIIGSGAVTSSGLLGTFRSATDLKFGRTALNERAGDQSTAAIFDGRSDWRQDYSRGVHALDSANARAAARSAAYLARNAYFGSMKNPGSVTCIGQRTEGDRSYYVLRLNPSGGVPIEQWIDSKTSLPDRSIEQTPTSTSVRWYSDYRQDDGLVLPFGLRVETLGDPADDTSFATARYVLMHSPREGDFRRPPDPRDTVMLNSRTSTTIPISIEAGDVIVEASVNGKGPFPFILDTGGHAILTPAAVHEIGLRTEGFATSGGAGASRVGLSFAFVRSLRIGAAEIPNQPVLVIPYDNDFSDRGAKAPLAGILGLELFERFAIRIDYAHDTLTMTPLAAFTYRGRGVHARLSFQEDEPLTSATADGVAGTFGVDTGNSGPIYFFETYLERHGFLARYGVGSAGSSSGTGGTVRSSSHLVNRFAIAEEIFHNIVGEFVLGQRGGSFSSTTEAGNFGYDVLARFVPTFDFRDEALYFEPTSSAPPPVFGRTGVSLSKTNKQIFTVIGVRPNSPAALAGLSVGDIVTSIDGVSSRDLGYADFYRINREAVGAIVRFRALHRQTMRTVDVKLTDLPLPRG